MLAAAALAGIVALAAPSPSTPGTTLRIEAKAPLTLRAAGFGRLEAVRIVAKAGKQSVTRTVRSDLSGRFTVAFPTIALDRATDLDVTAVGSRGHRASFELRHTTGGAVSKI